jgi:hypothetical protein
MTLVRLRERWRLAGLSAFGYSASWASHRISAERARIDRHCIVARPLGHRRQMALRPDANARVEVVVSGDPELASFPPLTAAIECRSAAGAPCLCATSPANRAGGFGPHRATHAPSLR